MSDQDLVFRITPVVHRYKHYTSVLRHISTIPKLSLTYIYCEMEIHIQFKLFIIPLVLLAPSFEHQLTQIPIWTSLH